MSITYKFSLKNILEGYIRNYRRLNLHQSNNKSMFTKREIDYFASLGESLGFISFVEDTKPNHDYGRSRPMDLAWWKWDERVSSELFQELVLHLERENLWNKDFETIEKLFCKTDKSFLPTQVIGIINVECKERINELQTEVIKRNKEQKSEVLMIYRYYDEVKNFDRVEAHYLSSDGQDREVRKAISDVDRTGYWMMCFDEEYKA